MAFWSQVSTEPKQKHRFKVSIVNLNQIANADGISDIVWYAKSVNLPSFEINQAEYQLGNHKFKYPGILSWNDITLTMVDPASRALDLLSSIKEAGYDIPGVAETGGYFLGGGGEGISKDKQAESGIGGMIINVLDANGVSREQYEFKGAFIKSMNLGDLSYDSEELVEIQMVIAYDFVEILVGTQTS